MRERREQARARRLADDPEVAGTNDDPFVRLTTPLSGPELRNLQEEVRRDNILFDQIERDERRAVRRRVIATGISLIVLSLFLAAVGLDYLTHDLVELSRPAFLVDRIGNENAGAVMFVLGLLAPLAALFVVADAISYILRGLADREAPDTLLGIAAGVLATCLYAFLYATQPLGALALAAVWIVVRGIAEAVLGRRR